MTGATGTAVTADRSRAGFSVRFRLTVAVALLVTSALAGAGLLVYAVETGQVHESVEREVEQELDEFQRLHDDGIDPETGKGFRNASALLRTFLLRNVPDDDEMLVGWVGGGPRHVFPDDPLLDDPGFREAARPLVTSGGTAWIDTRWGEVRITSQPVHQGSSTGALLVVAYLDEDMAELHDTMRTYAAVSGLSLLIVVALAAWLSGRLLRPLRTLRRTADEIGESDLSRRIPLTGNDDLTALARTVNGMLDRLESAFVGQRRFLDDAGHELRTPLTVVQGHLELLDESNPAEVAATRALVLDEVDRMARLVQDLILLAKSDRPDFVTVAPVDVTDLTVEVLAKAKALGDRTWTLDSTAAVTVEADGQRLTQALLQLCHNALKHTRPGDAVAVGSDHDGSVLRLWVRDTGPGIPEEVREEVFTRFTRGPLPRPDDPEHPEQGDDTGFGLGLAIVRAIATAHGGAVGIQDAVPHGAVVVMRLRAPDLATRPDQSTEEHPVWPAS